MEALTDSAFRQLCALIEDGEDRLHPDAVAYSGDLPVYRHLVDLGALSLGDGIGVGILCPWCGGVDLADVRCDQSRYRGYCTDCGWVDLAPEQVRPWRLELNRIVRWLASALGLTGRFQIEERVPQSLWRLGEIEHRRRRHTVFFGRRLDDPTRTATIERQLRAVCAPGCGVLFTTTPHVAEPLDAGTDCVVPLRAVAHLRKAGFVIENLDAYLDEAPRDDTSPETSLRLMHSSRRALIEGRAYPLSRQVYRFLRELEEAGGDPVHKHALAEALQIDVEQCKGASIFKRHKAVYHTFVDHNHEGHYWLKAEVIDDDWMPHG